MFQVSAELRAACSAHLPLPLLRPRPCFHGYCRLANHDAGYYPAEYPITIRDVICEGTGRNPSRFRTDTAGIAEGGVAKFNCQVFCPLRRPVDRFNG